MCLGSSSKQLEQPHPELVHWWLLVHSSQCVSNCRSDRKLLTWVQTRWRKIWRTQVQTRRRRIWSGDHHNSTPMPQLEWEGKANCYSDLTAAQCLWLAICNDWFRWFATSSPLPICGPSFSFMAQVAKMWITKLGCEKHFCSNIVSIASLEML
jgi:hypothetical protein